MGGLKNTGSKHCRRNNADGRGGRVQLLNNKNTLMCKIHKQYYGNIKKLFLFYLQDCLQCQLNIFFNSTRIEYFY